MYEFLATQFSSHPTQPAVRSVREMAAALEFPCPPDLSPGELDAEYMALFIVPGPRYTAPYESVFRDRWQLPAALRRGSNPGETGTTIKGLLMGESTLAVQDCYRRAGVLPETELPDHIANELRFMAHLWRREAETPGNEAGRYVQLRSEFCTQHLLKWVHLLYERVVENGDRGYYALLLQIAESVLEYETNA